MDDEQEHAYASGAVQDGPGLTAGAALIYDGDEPIVLCQGEGALVPARVAEPLPDDNTSVHAVLTSTGGPDIVPGLWPQGQTEGMVFVTNLDVLEINLD